MPRMLGLALLPTEPADNDRLVSYADAVMSCGPAISQLGTNSLPHVTLMHVRTAGNPADVASGLGELIGRECEVRASGLHLIPFTVPYNAPPDIGVQVMCEVPVDLTPELAALRGEVLAGPLPVQGEVTVGGPGWPWRPHFTLGFASGPLTAVPPLPPFTGQAIRCRVALGVMGALGVFERTVEAVAL